MLQKDVLHTLWEKNNTADFDISYYKCSGSERYTAL